jgi:hypothetical protein
MQSQRFNRQKYIMLTKMSTDSRIQERAREFKYLGYTVTEDNCITTDIQHRTAMTNRAGYGLNKLWYFIYIRRS